MGNAKSSAMSKEILEDLKLNTKFSENELSQWYENFQKQCPSGRITPEEFKKIYERFFPECDTTSYAQHVFRSFDTNDDGTLDFKEYIIALHMTSTGKTERKLEWAFSLFDVDKNGYITKSEVAEICQAIFKLIPKEDQESLPADENTPEKRADKLWSYFNKKDNERLAEGEFIQGILENEDAIHLIQFEHQKK
ncbi:recoverin 2 [Danio rerio]|uniref:Recoverin n=1 Tax=Danio rerio TaxID=7955 RepID=Q6PC38_DANRE|nr:recoverin 2 [Danio rerio]AAH59485.1 Recoverin [Danio rerio]ALA04608.1 recoverin-2a [Danio rerio]|eukprot:NP_956258.1 recoverin 2 [Danio rerio]